MRLLSLNCPKCRQPPYLVVGDRQAFCETEGCAVLTWDRAADPARFDETAATVDQHWMRPAP